MSNNVQIAGSNSIMTVPLAGGIVLPELKRGEFTVQYVEFEVDLMDFFKKYPNDHFGVIIDGALDASGNPFVPYAGRGAIFENDAFGYLKISYEDFNTAALAQPQTLANNARDIFNVRIEAGELTVRRQIKNRYGVVLLDDIWAKPDNTGASKTSNIILFAISDFSPGPKQPANIRISNISHGQYNP